MVILVGCCWMVQSVEIAGVGDDDDLMIVMLIVDVFFVVLIDFYGEDEEERKSNKTQQQDDFVGLSWLISRATSHRHSTYNLSTAYKLTM
jgi:hypothetical protein